MFAVQCCVSQTTTIKPTLDNGTEVKPVSFWQVKVTLIDMSKAFLLGAVYRWATFAQRLSS